MKYSLEDWKRATEAHHTGRKASFDIERAEERRGRILVWLKNYNSPKEATCLTTEFLEPIFGGDTERDDTSDPRTKDLKKRWLAAGLPESEFEPSNPELIEEILKDIESNNEPEEAEEAPAEEEEVAEEEPEEEVEEEPEEEPETMENEEAQELVDEGEAEIPEDAVVDEPEEEEEPTETVAEPVKKKSKPKSAPADLTTSRMIKVVNKSEFIDAYDFLEEMGLINDDMDADDIDKVIDELYEVFNRFVAGCQYSGEFRKVKTRKVSNLIVPGYTEMIKRIVNVYPDLVKFGLVDDKFILKHK